MLPLFAFGMRSEEAVKLKINLIKTTGEKLSRSQLSSPVESYYYGMLSAVYTTAVSDLGEIDVRVTNISTGESWEDNFDSSSISQHLLPISSTSGLYEVTYTTSSSDIYEGTFIIE